MSITVVLPSRGRPARAWEAVDAALDLAELPTTRVLLVVDADDPEIDGYLARPADSTPGWSRLVLTPDQTGSLVKATNSASMMLVNSRECDCIIGNLGDDHVVRTPGWDVEIEKALLVPGIAYGDDLLQGERLPTAPFISASIIRALGWYALPSCRHMYIDDAWKALGNRLGVLRYCPNVIIEHVHPGAGKADPDEGYARADASTTADGKAYLEWRNTTFYDDVANARAALS